MAYRVEGEPQIPTFAELVEESVWIPFEVTRNGLHAIRPLGRQAKGLLEFADNVVYDEADAHFYQVYPDVPTIEDREKIDIRIPMKFDEIDLFIKHLKASLPLDTMF